MSQGYTKGIPIDTDNTLALNSDFIVPSQKAVKGYVDTNLLSKQDTLNSGVNIKTVNNQSILGAGNIDFPVITLFKQNTDITHTGTLDETIIANYEIPAGTFDVNDFIDINAKFFASNTANTKRIDCYINSSNSLVGAQRIGLRTATTGQQGYFPFKRTLSFNNNLSDLRVAQNATSYTTDENTPSQVLNSLTINCSNTVYMIFTATLVDITDSAGIRNIIVQRLR
jgi:hypothetical protein